MTWAEVLGSLKPYDDNQHGFILDVGHRFGAYQEALHDTAIPPNRLRQTCANFIEDINDGLVSLGFEVKVQENSKLSLDRAVADLRRIRVSIYAATSPDVTVPIYFYIGVATGILLAGVENKDSKVRAKKTLHDINMFALDMEINHEALCDELHALVMGSHAVMALNLVKMRLQGLRSNDNVIFVSVDPAGRKLFDAQRGFGAVKTAVDQRTEPQEPVPQYKRQTRHLSGRGDARGVAISNEAGQIDVVQVKDLTSLIRLISVSGTPLVSQCLAEQQTVRCSTAPLPTSRLRESSSGRRSRRHRQEDIASFSEACDEYDGHGEEFELLTVRHRSIERSEPRRSRTDSRRPEKGYGDQHADCHYYRSSVRLEKRR
ncbi:hypothetical protein HYQ46_006082 [Verticillium longisporum]|uniref:Uncharacterized protein n=1 Tax=Verticillium longisporum TaxID=100787 RepID=A0A0G4M922_VERLO|nr:hypothetical protein HYQ46_006082 [Verticillium longisporum]CRK30774.1 hypothetical protein BN1708_015860 [Verticillium longisporum]